MNNDMPEWLKKCLSCTHSYHRQDDADTIYCRCKNGECHYQKKDDRRKTEKIGQE